MKYLLILFVVMLSSCSGTTNPKVADVIPANIVVGNGDHSQNPEDE